MSFSQQYHGSSNPNDKAIELRENKDSIDWRKLSSNPKAIELLLNNPDSLAIDLDVGNKNS